MSQFNKRFRDPEHEAELIKEEPTESMRKNRNPIKLEYDIFPQIKTERGRKDKQQQKNSYWSQQESDKKNGNEDNFRKLEKKQFILDKKLRDQMLEEKNIFRHQIHGRQFYFPKAELYKAQQKFIGHIFKCLDKKGTNAMIESSTGTGKTLSLLVSTLSWADDLYYKSEEKFGPQTKIIYLSRAHSQLSQIAKELEKTPYRPHMIIYGARQKLCVNKKVLQALEGQGSNQEQKYGKWLDYCNSAVKSRKEQLKMGKDSYAQQYADDCEVREQMSRQQALSSLDRKQKSQQVRKQLSHELKCDHYNDYKFGGEDNDFFKKVAERKVINHAILKKLAVQSETKICPYFYPKRVRNWASLILMPYNYLLDHRTLESAEKLVKDSIIIFDEGHNVASTACNGYDIKFTLQTIEDARNNAKGENPLKKDPKAIPGNYFNVQDAQMQDAVNFDTTKKQEDLENNQDQALLKKKITRKQFEAALKWTTQVMESQSKKFQQYFESGERTTLGQVPHDNKDNSQYKSREFHTMESKQIRSKIGNIFFDRSLSHFANCKNLQQMIEQTLKNMETVIEYYKDLSIFYWKIKKLHSFFYRVLKVITDDDEYKHRFFFWFIQYRRFDQQSFEYAYKGEILINCLAPEFAFKKLKKLQPRSIIVASGTLKPMEAFTQELGIQFKQLDAGHIIEQDNVKVRIIKNGLQGEPLKFTSNVFLTQNYEPNLEPISIIYKLIIKLLPSIPNGVLVILPSTKVLRAFQKVYKNNYALKNKIDPLKEVYFEAQRWQSQMKKFNKDAKSDKGAIMFCVCKGKLSQGIDFKDKLCRSVMFIGVPFLPPEGTDVKLDYKQKYLQQIKSPFSSLWKFIDVSKAINQAMGRVIRHKYDYGSIILIDQRYDLYGGGANWMSEKVIDNLSAWVTNRWKVADAQHLGMELKLFYGDCEQKFPVEENDKLEEEIEEEKTENEKKYLQNRYNQQLF